MELVMNSNLSALSDVEIENINGGGVTAFVYALGFMAGVAPVWVCVGGAMVLVGTGMCIYDAITN